MNAGHDGVRVVGLVAGDVFVLKAIDPSRRKQAGAVGVNGRALGDDRRGRNSRIGGRGRGRSATCMRARPSRRPSPRSTATMIGTLPVPAPGRPVERPPTKISSSSTAPAAGRDPAAPSPAAACASTPRRFRRSRTRAHRCNPCAETPFFCEVMNQIAANQVANGDSGAVKDGSRGHRCLTAALGAHEQSAAGAPIVARLADRTGKPVRPAQFLQIGRAGRVVGKPGQQLLIGARIVRASDRSTQGSPPPYSTAVKRIPRTYDRTRGQGRCRAGGRLGFGPAG